MVYISSKSMADAANAITSCADADSSMFMFRMMTTATKTEATMAMAKEVTMAT